MYHNHERGLFHLYEYFRYHWMYNATAYNHAYADTGLFCIHASAPPPRLGDTVDIISKEIVAMAGSCSEQELRVFFVVRNLIIYY